MLKVCSGIEGIGIDNPQTEVTGVTSLVQEACEQVSVLGAHYTKPTSENLQLDLQDLKEYFRRPRLILSGTFSLGTSLRITSIPMAVSDIFSTYFPNGLLRLTGVYGVRFHMVFTLQVATNPFHQGLLALAYQPLYDSSATTTFDRSSFSATVTNLPHVRLDLSQSTMVQLEIPFIYDHEFMVLREGDQDDLGRLSLNSLLPIIAPAGTSPPTYKLLMHLENMELIGVYPEDTSTYVLQAGRKPMNEEFENEAYPFSSSLSALSRSVKWISRGIPAISSIAGPTSWFLSKTAGAVRSFGFSKPQVQEPLMRVNRMAGVAEHNVDVPSATVMVGPMASNQLKVDPSFAFSDVDEMSFPYILGQWGQIYRASLTTSDAINTRLYTTVVSPSYFWFRAPGAPSSGQYRAPILSGATANSFLPSHVFALASMFRQWRGSFKLRFTFSKTKMHGGRILCTYFPYRTIGVYGDAAPTVRVPLSVGTLPQPFTSSAIFDLRDNNVFEFDVPFVSKLPHVDFLDGTGFVTLTVLDPLQAPSVVSNSIDYLVEVKCNPDFEVSIPTAVRYPAHANGTPKYQSGRVVSTVASNVCELTVGESLNSVKQLISIPKASRQGFAANNAVTQMLIMPWFYQPLQSVLVPGPTNFTPEAFGFGGNIANWYIFARGSTDAHAYSTAVPKLVLSFSAAPSNNNGVTTINTPNNVSAANLPTVFEYSTGVAHCRFPAYMRLLRWVSTALNNNVWVGRIVDANANPAIGSGDPSSSVVYPRLNVQNFTGATQPLHITRSAGDDAMLGLYCGPPPFALLSANSTASYDPDCPIFS